MPVYVYQGKHYEMSETDPEAARAKIQAAIGEKPSTSTSGKAAAQKESKGIVDYALSSREPESLSIGKIMTAGAEAAAPPAAMAAASAVIPGAQPAAIPLGLAAGGFFLSGASGELSRQLGASPVTQFATEMVGGAGIEKAITSGLVSGTIAAKRTIQGLADLNFYKAGQGIKSLLGASEEQVAKKTAAQQAATFGEKTPGYVAGQTSGANAAKAQEDLAKEHRLGEAVYYTPSGKVSEKAPKAGTDISTGKEDLTRPSTTVRGAGDKTEQLTPRIRQAKIDPKTGQPQKVSEVLRDEMYDEVGKITVASPSERFSVSQPFKDLQAKLQERVDRGQITRADKLQLENILKSDQKGPNVQKVYGETVDEQIRGWAGKLNAEGKSALDASISNSVRDDLRNSFAKWTEERGLGKIEKDYRSAYTKEKTAEAKDNIPRIIAGYDGSTAMDKFVTQMKDNVPEAKDLMLKEMNKHFANIEAKDLPSEFKRLDKLFVRSNLFKPEELQGIREQIANLEKVEVNPEAFGIKMKRILTRAFKRAAVSTTISEATNR